MYGQTLRDLSVDLGTAVGAVGVAVVEVVCSVAVDIPDKSTMENDEHRKRMRYEEGSTGEM